MTTTSHVFTTRVFWVLIPMQSVPPSNNTHRTANDLDKLFMTGGQLWPNAVSVLFNADCKMRNINYYIFLMLTLEFTQKYHLCRSIPRKKMLKQAPNQLFPLPPCLQHSIVQMAPFTLNAVQGVRQRVPIRELQRTVSFHVGRPAYVQMGCFLMETDV